MLLAFDEEDDENQQPRPKAAEQAAAPQQVRAPPQGPAKAEGQLLLLEQDDVGATPACPSKPKPPPPPPEPREDDLNEVYVPTVDSSIQGCLPKADIGVDLLGLDGVGVCTAATLASPRVSNGLDMRETLEKCGKPQVLDLSKPSPEGPEEPQTNRKGGSTSSTAVRSPSPPGSSKPLAPMNPIPCDAKGFGSEDLFGKRTENRNVQEQIQEEAAAAFSAVVGMLPANIQGQMPACSAPPVDAKSEVVLPPARSAGYGPAAEEVSASISARARQDGPSAEAYKPEHTQAAVHRATEGRWVPTYMRHQLATNGHTGLPAAPNAHEQSADRPPSLNNAFAELGAELGETAQTMFNFFVAMLSSLSVQCQVCSVHTAGSLHEQVINYGENMCYGVPEDTQTELTFGQPMDESLAGLGPMRSRVQRTVEIGFADLTNLVKTKLVTGQMPAELAQAVSYRGVKRCVAQQVPAVEDWLFTTELNPDAFPADIVEHLCQRSANVLERPKIQVQEGWHVIAGEERAVVEMTSSPAGGSVIIFLRINIAGSSSSQGCGSCSVDSRVYARRREHGAVLPLGLVEHLMQFHQNYAEALQAVVVSSTKATNSCQSAGQTAAPAACGASARGGSDGGGAPNCKAAVGSAFINPAALDEPARSGVGPDVGNHLGDPSRHQGWPVLKETVPKEGNISLDTSLLLKVANAI